MCAQKRDLGSGGIKNGGSFKTAENGLGVVDFELVVLCFERKCRVAGACETLGDGFACRFRSSFECVRVDLEGAERRVSAFGKLSEPREDAGVAGIPL